MSYKKLIASIILINYFQLQVLFCFVDFNSVQNDYKSIGYNLTTVILKNVEAKRSYMFKWLDFIDGTTTTTTIPQLVVSLPPQLRLLQQTTLPTRFKTEVVDTYANFRFKAASLLHQGFYTAFKVINNSLDGKPYVFIDEKRNFYINVIGLSKEGDECYEDGECESNHCLNSTCVCNRVKSVPIDQICYSAQPIGHKCFHSEQCTSISGPDSECGYKGLCRCSTNAFPIDIPRYGKYCIKPKLLYDKCIYSEECQTIGSNRYCNEDFNCQCIPGSYYRVGIGCVEASNHISRLMPSPYVWPLLGLAFAAYVY